MKGIYFKKVDDEKFTKIFNEVHKIREDIQLLLDKKLSEKLISEAAAEEVGVTVRTIYAYIKKGTLPASKVVKKLLTKRSDFEKALKEVKSLKYKR